MNTVILNFHGIGRPHEGVDADERPYWVTQGFYEEVVALATAHPARESIGFTFDDGNASDLAIAAPVLAAAKLKGEFFILTGRFDREHYLSRAEIAALRAMGMEVGLHGRDHVDWTALDEAALEAETKGARADLEACLGAAIDSVAIPFGRYNAKVIRRLRGCGFRGIYTSDGGAARSEAVVKGRTSIRADMSLNHVSAILDQREAPSKRARRAASVFVRRHLV